MCEYLQSPIGVDVPDPGFRWQLAAEQTAYRIMVDTDSAKVAGGAGALGDSGQINGSARAYVAPAGLFGLIINGQKVCAWLWIARCHIKTKGDVMSEERQKIVKLPTGTHTFWIVPQ